LPDPATGVVEVLGEVAAVTLAEVMPEEREEAGLAVEVQEYIAAVILRDAQAGQAPDIQE
jgi:hypothetical protein